MLTRIEAMADDDLATLHRTLPDIRRRADATA